MANTYYWDSGTSSFVVTLVPPDKEGGTPGSANIQLSATPVTPKVLNRVYSSYNGPPVNGQGFGYSWWQIPPPGVEGLSPTWNIQGPAYGAQPIVFYITPTVQVQNQSWSTCQTPTPGAGPNQYKFNDPLGGGSSSVTIEMIDPGGGGLKM